MFKDFQTRENARALLGAALTGSAVGLILAAAYLGGSLAQAGSRATAPAAEAILPAQASLAPSIPAVVNTQGARSSELLKASLSGPAAKPYRSSAQSDLECLTQAIYYEARGEGSAGQAAVAQVVLNRVRHPSFPKSVCAVVYQGCQFSFACDGSTRRGRERGAWNRAQRIAAQALSGAVVANVGAATHFHTVNVSPKWGPNLLRVGQVGLHIFYRLSGRNGRAGVLAEAETPPEPGLYEYARLQPGDPVYLTSATVTTKVELTPSIGPVEVAMVSPAAEAAAKAPAPVEVKAEAPTAATAAPSAGAAS